MRFEKPRGYFNKILKRHSNKSYITISPIDLIRSISDIWLIMFFFTDHYLFFHRLGYLPISKPIALNIDWWNSVTWLLNVLCEILCDTLEIVFTPSPKSPRLLSIFLNASDIPIIFFFLDLNVGPIFAGFSGALCSAINLFLMF